MKYAKKALAALPLLLISALGQANDFALDKMDIRAQLSPKRFTTLSAEFGARITQITVREGQSFRAGQALVKFDCAVQQAQLSKARAHQAAAEDTLEGNRRLDALNAVGKLEVKNAESEVQKAKADVSYLQAMLSKCAIAAPFSGRVAERKAQEQQFVQPGQALLDIIDDSSLELEFIMPARWLSWAKPGHKFKVHIEATNKLYPVKLLRLGARIDPVSDSIKAVAVVDGSFPELIAGMSGKVLLKPETNTPPTSPPPTAKAGTKLD